MKFYTKDELFEVLKHVDREELLFIHVFPFSDADYHKFYTYLCDVKSAFALTAMLPFDTRYIYKIK